jgi:anti-sigma factor RsiW
VTKTKKQDNRTQEVGGPSGPTSCHELPQDLLEKYLLRDASPAERERVEAHLAVCPSCRRAAARANGLVAFLLADGAVQLARLQKKKPRKKPPAGE